MTKATRVAFGNVHLYRLFCPDCQSTALVINGRMACCDKRVERADRFTEHRETNPAYVRRLTETQRREILKQQDNKCAYCGYRFFTIYRHPKSGKWERYSPVFDHFVPWCYSQNNSSENYVAACKRCNSIKAALVFDSVETARYHILKRRLAKGDITEDWIAEHDPPTVAFAVLVSQN